MKDFVACNVFKKAAIMEQHAYVVFQKRAFPKVKLLNASIVVVMAVHHVIKHWNHYITEIHTIITAIHWLIQFIHKYNK